MSLLSWLLPSGVIDQKQPSQPIAAPHKSSFSVCVSRVLAHEGGYVNHPNDPGGATNYGITQAVARRHGYTGDMKMLSLDKAMSIYRSDYWDEGKCSELPQAIAFQYFDACVNHGLGRAAKLLQEALQVPVDGIVGPKTLAAANSQNQSQVVMRFNQHRIRFYTGLKTFPSFGKGWVNRIADNLKYGALDAN